MSINSNRVPSKFTNFNLLENGNQHLLRIYFINFETPTSISLICHLLKKLKLSDVAVILITNIRSSDWDSL